MVVAGPSWAFLSRRLFRGKRYTTQTDVWSFASTVSLGVATPHGPWGAFCHRKFLVPYQSADLPNMAKTWMSQRTQTEFRIPSCKTERPPLFSQVLFLFGDALERRTMVFVTRLKVCDTLWRCALLPFRANSCVCEEGWVTGTSWHWLLP